MTVGHWLFGFTGRIHRARFWGAVAVYIIVWLLVLAIAMAFIFQDINQFVFLVSFGWLLDPAVIGRVGAIAIVIAIVGVVIFVSAMAVMVKRLHDRDKSGWWVLLFWGVPVALNGWRTANVPEGQVSVVDVIAGAISIWALVELGFLRGTSGPNRFGYDPVPDPFVRPGTMA